MRNVQVKVDGIMVLSGLVVAGGVLAYMNRQKIGQAINPASDQNLAYKSVNAVGSELTGDDSFSFGAWMWEITHPDQVQKEREIIGDPNVLLYYEHNQGAM